MQDGTAAPAIARNTRAVRLGDSVVEVVATDASAVYWRSVAEGRWEPATLRFMARAMQPGSVFVDVGAWVGPLSLLAARMGARIIALEPDPAAFAELKTNLDANGVVGEALNAALHTGPEGITLYAPGGAGRSVSTSFGAGDGIAAASMSVDDLSVRIRGARPHADAPVIIKIDIEGHEFVLGDNLAALWREHAAALHLSLHPRAIWEAARPRMGDLRARRAAFDATMRLLAPFRAGAIRLSNAPFAPVTPMVLFQAFRTPRPKNFTVEIGRPR